MVWFYLKKIDDLKTKYHTESVVICGDFNTVLDNTLDIVSGGNHEIRCTEAFSKFLLSCSLVDLEHQMVH